MSESLRRTSPATLGIAVFDGLMLELMATGERRRLTRVLDEFIALIRARQWIPGRLWEALHAPFAA